MKKLKFVLIILFFLFLSIGAVSADGNLTSLEDAIKNSEDSIELTQDYKYDNMTDAFMSDGITIAKDDFVVNGNGHTIDASNETRIFEIMGNNVTLKNLVLINGKHEKGGGINSLDTVNIENVTFISNTADNGAAIYCKNANINNCNFSNNTATNGVIYGDKGTLNIESSVFENMTNLTYSIIYAKSQGNLTIEDCTFLNSQAKYATAIYTSRKTYINNTIFFNLTAELSGGAIGIKGNESVNIDNTIFINMTAKKNGGSIFTDITQKGLELMNVTFINSTADFGGAICHLGGYLYINVGVFNENTATYDGGAIYTSDANLQLENSGFTENKVTSGENSHGGAIYLDRARITIINNNIIENNTGHGLYAYDSHLNISTTQFSGNDEDIHAVFSTYELHNMTLKNNTVNFNDTNYFTFMEENGIKIELNNNSITVKDLPIRFDSRDWGWVTPVKDQGNNGACWAFGINGALESALLKATGISYDFSENNVQNTMLEYSKYGISGYIEGGITEQGLFYALSWIGMAPGESDAYDELGKISPAIKMDGKIHVQDSIIIPARNNFTDNDKLKEAIMKCGAVAIGYYATFDEDDVNTETGAFYQNTHNNTNHLVAAVGWDDTYSAKNFETTPPGDGAFIVKNSWGTDSGKDGYYYISYYDTSLLKNETAIGFIINNTENYTKNYQSDIGGDITEVNTTGYKITYKSQGNDLISAVGTYFKENENYTIEIYVNNELIHTQNATSPFYGFHTVKLTKEIPVKENDNFTAVMKKASGITYKDSRLHYPKNMTFMEMNGKWIDLAEENKTTTLKVYTKDLSIYTKDLVKIYKNESQFEALIDSENETVIFEINGANYTRTSNENGVASMNINLKPGNYTVKTTYDETTVENNIEVLPTLIAENLVKYFRNESQFYISLIDGSGNAVANVNITMNINGVFYNRTTNANGTARLNINLAPGEYILTATDPLTGLEMSYNITVLPILTAEDINMTYLDGTQFKATLVDGQGKALSGAKVQFNVNGVFYYRETDSNGTASLNINLIAGEYIITSQYEDAVVSNKITITAKED